MRFDFDFMFIFLYCVVLFNQYLLCIYDMLNLELSIEINRGVDMSKKIN